MASTATHYATHSASSYEEAYFYEPGAYMQYLVDLVIQRMRFGTTITGCAPRHLADIGGGTGNFANELVKHCPSNNLHVTVVEPFLEETTSSELTKGNDVAFVKAPAEVFLSPPSDSDNWRKQEFHQVLIKETIHHLDEKVRVDILKGLYNELKAFPRNCDANNTPSILIITRPQVEIDYPIWNAARKVWKENQPSSELLQQELQMAGFVDIKCTMEKYDSSISLTRWQSMVRNRFWSTFADFTDEELEAGCQELASERPPDEDGIIHFEDRLLFISGRKDV